MKKTIIVSIFILFSNLTVSFSAERPCSEHNRLTHYKLYKECMDSLKGDKKNKSKFNLSGANEKYKNLRKKYAPKTGSEIWKDYKKSKQ